MGRGGRGRMAGMAGGVLSGAIWGSIVGGLVLLLAALLLDLGDGAERGAPPPGAVPATPPDAEPMRLPGIASTGPPDGALPRTARPVAISRSLVPRPAQPVLPALIAGARVPGPVADLPPEPESAPETVSDMVPEAPIAAPLAVAQMPPPGVAASFTRPAPPVVPETEVRSRGAPALSDAPPVASVPDRVPAPGALIDAPAAPAIATAPEPGGTPPLPGAPDLATPRGALPAHNPLPDVAPPPPPPPPQPLGPRVAFVLEGTPPMPPPDWIGARAGAGGSGPVVLAGGGMVVTDPAAARAGALLAYARLAGAEAADATTLARIALRARRDGAVTVLVSPDPALWDRIGAWLDGPARDLIPVSAASLPD